MRLKEERSNWHASAVERKNFRRGAQTDRIRRPRSKKDTKKWCKGKVGVLHNPQITGFKRVVFGWVSMIIEWKCDACGKEWSQWLRKPL